MKNKYRALLVFLAMAFVFSGNAAAEDLKLSDIISGEGSVSATGGGKTTTYSGDAAKGLKKEAPAAPAATTVKASDATPTGNRGTSTGGGALQLSDIISGNGSVSATGGGKTTTYSGDPKTGIRENTSTTNGEPGSDQGITWNEYMQGLDALNADIENRKITEAEWNEKTQALRSRFLAGERNRGPHQTNVEPPPFQIVGPGNDPFGNDPFGDTLGPSNGKPMHNPGNPTDNHLGSDIFVAPGGPGTFPGAPFDDSLLNDPAFQDQRFGELFGGKFFDNNEKPN